VTAAVRVPAAMGTCVLVTAAALMLVPALLGYKRYVITGGSMTGTLAKGSLAYERPVSVARLRVGDVITYAPPAGAGPRGLVTHRIAWSGRGRDGRRLFRTKGDFNRSADPWRFTLERATQPRLAFSIPLAGYVFAALAVRWLRMLVIGVPALVVAVAALRA
jgi:signal peptidase I